VIVAYPSPPDATLLFFQFVVISMVNMYVQSIANRSALLIDCPVRPHEAVRGWWQSSGHTLPFPGGLRRSRVLQYRGASRINSRDHLQLIPPRSAYCTCGRSRSGTPTPSSSSVAITNADISQITSPSSSNVRSNHRISLPNIITTDVNAT